MRYLLPLFAALLVITASPPRKYRDNLTFNCTTPYSGGTAVGTTNN
jgi:hypothetical protein